MCTYVRAASTGAPVCRSQTGVIQVVKMPHSRQKANFLFLFSYPSLPPLLDAVPKHVCEFVDYGDYGTSDCAVDFEDYWVAVLFWHCVGNIPHQDIASATASATEHHYRTYGALGLGAVLLLC